MNSVAIVTLTRFNDIFDVLAESVCKHEKREQLKIAISSDMHPTSKGWFTAIGTEPFIWARNANLGVRIASDSDVLLTNDDVQWTQPTVKALQAICEANPEIGLLSPQILGNGINNVLAMAKTPLSGDYVESKAYIPCVCVFLPRRVIDVVGPFNESFAGYGGDDIEYCDRVQKAGFKLAVTPKVKVHHGFGDRTYSSSFLRVMSEAERNQKVRESMAQAQEIRS